MAYCPKCNQTFAEGGFCPYDGTTLKSGAHPNQAAGSAVAASAKPTQLGPNVNPTQQGASAKPTQLGPNANPTQPGAKAQSTTKRFDDNRAPSEPNIQVGTEPGFSGSRDLKIISAASGSGGMDDVLRKLRAQEPKAAEYDRLIGATLDNRYYIDKKIGEGGMGVVFLAKHTIIEKLVAIKVLKREVARDHSVVKRFVQEAKAASRIGHPNIADVTDFGTTPDGMTYSVMEFVDGDTLAKVIKNSAPMGLSRALPIIAQLAKALGAAHEKGIVHRDLKPENVFLIDRDGRPDFVKVVDFGIAKVMPMEGPETGPRLTRAGTVFGTPEYMAPEQAAGRSDTDQRVDIYALGTILYEMIVGKVPHKGPTMVRTLAMQMLDPIPLPRKARPELTISDEFERVLMKSLAKKREDRYDSMATFLVDLEGVSAVPLSIPLSPKSAPAVMPRAGAGEHTMLEGGASRPSVLPALPPGANAEKLAAESTGHATKPRSKRASSQIDPAFLDGSPAFDHVFENPPVTRGSVAKWPVVLAVLMLLAGGAYGLFWLSQRGEDETAKREPVALTDKTDAAATPQPVDAGAALDALDAVNVIAKVPPDARTRNVPIWRGRRVDAGTKIRYGEPVMVRINTRPEGARVFINGVYRGTSQDGGVAISEPFGTRLVASCKLPGYKTASVVVVFNKKRFTYDCMMKRIKKCVPGLKNPFDECPK